VAASSCATQRGTGTGRPMGGGRPVMAMSLRRCGSAGFRSDSGTSRSIWKRHIRSSHPQWVYERRRGAGETAFGWMNQPAHRDQHWRTASAQRHHGPATPGATTRVIGSGISPVRCNCRYFQSHQGMSIARYSNFRRSVSGYPRSWWAARVHSRGTANRLPVIDRNAACLNPETAWRPRIGVRGCLPTSTYTEAF
jgi:hypothetical protein